MLAKIFDINNIYSALANGTNLSFATIALSFLLTSVISIYIFLIYKYSYKQTFYSHDFNLILPGISIITTALVITMHSTLLVFLGTISTLSLIRFRHSLKNPLDSLYLLWAISNGIFCGVQLYVLSLLLSIFITLIFLYFDTLHIFSTTYILTITCSSTDFYDRIYKITQNHCTHIEIKNHKSTSNGLSYVFSIKTKKEDLLLNELSKTPSLHSINLSSYSGEYREN